MRFLIDGEAGGALPSDESTLRALLNATPNAVLLIDKKGRVLFCNRATTVIFGYQQEALIGNNVSVLMREPDRLAHDDHLSRYAQIGQSSIMGVGRELAGLHKDGHALALHVSIGEVAMGNEVVYLGMMADISARVASENEVRRQCDMLEIISLAINSFLRLESEEEISKQLTRALLKVTGSERALIAELVEDEQGGEVLRALPVDPEVPPMSALASRRVDGRLEFRRLDNPIAYPLFTQQILLTNDPTGHPAWMGTPVVHSGVRNFLGIPIKHDNEVLGVFAIANREGGYDQRLVNELEPVREALAAILCARRLRREAVSRQKSVERANERLRRIVEASPMGVAVFDENGIYETVNPAYCAIYGYAREELLGQCFTMVFPEDSRERVLALHKQFIADGLGLRGQWTVMARNGETRFVVTESVRIETDAGSFHRLAFVTNISEQVLLQKDLEQKNLLLQRQADHDGLTHALNHRRILEVLETERLRAARHGNSLCIAMLDMDNFKLVNDVHGHMVGDEVLRTTATVLHSGVRAIDSVGRYGGEEFLLLLPDASIEGAVAVVERLRFQVETSRFSVPDLKVSFSAGVTGWLTGETCSEMLIRVDALLYEAKRLGRGRCCSDLDTPDVDGGEGVPAT